MAAPVALPALGGSNAVLFDFDADAVSGVADGAAAGLFPDRVAGRNAVQATAAAQGVYTAANTSFNGHSTITTNGTSSFYVSGKLPARSANRTIVAVFQALTTASGPVFLDSTGRNQVYYSGAAASSTSIYNGAARDSFGARLTTPQVVVAAFTSGASLWGQQNGAGRVATASATASYLDDLVIGATTSVSATAGSAWANAAFSRVVVFDGVLSDGDVIRLDSWVQSTYGITVADYTTNTAPAAPTVPSSVTATATTSTTAKVLWVSSTDFDGVSSYQVTRNGVVVAPAVAGSPFLDTGLAPSTSYSYTVDAVATTGLRSAESAAAACTTPAADPATTPGATQTIAQLPPTGMRMFHRGSGNPATTPEHTFAAYDNALSLGVHFIDLDVNDTADPISMDYHDPTFDRCSSVSGNISSTLRANLPPVRMPNYVGQGWPDQPIPSVDEVLARYGGKAILNIEPKVASDTPNLIAKLKNAGLANSSVINSPSTSVIQQAAQAGIFAHCYNNSSTATVDAAATAGANIIEFNSGSITPDLVAYAKAKPGVKFVICNPIQNRYQRDVALAAGVDAFVSDGVGYLDRVENKTSLASEIAARRVGAGWWRTSYTTPWFNAGGLDLSGPRYRLGTLHGPKPGTYTLHFRYRFDAISNTAGRPGFRFAVVDDRGTGQDSDVGYGYEAHVRADGLFQVYKGGQGSFTLLGQASTAPPVAGAEHDLRVDVTPTTITVTRVTTGDVLGPFTDSSYRGNNLWILGSTVGDPMTLTGVDILSAATPPAHKVRRAAAWLATTSLVRRAGSFIPAPLKTFRGGAWTGI